jgi:hypothetical protein
MSSEKFDEILRYARETLTPDECRKLSDELRQNNDLSNGDVSPKSIYDALNQLGVIGSITDGPGDLSTNPMHMEGFGKHGK